MTDGQLEPGNHLPLEDMAICILGESSCGWLDDDGVSWSTEDRSWLNTAGLICCRLEESSSVLITVDAEGTSKPRLVLEFLL